MLGKFVQWLPSCFMRTDGQIDTTKLTVAFSNFAKAPKKNVSITHRRQNRNPSLYLAMNLRMYLAILYFSEQIPRAGA